LGRKNTFSGGKRLLAFFPVQGYNGRLMKLFSQLIIIFLLTINALHAQEWVEKNKTPVTNYFAELPEAGRWVELMRSISLNPSTKIKAISGDKRFFQLFLDDEYMAIEIGPLHMKSPRAKEVIISYLYTNYATMQSALYVIFKTHSRRALLSCFDEHGLIQYIYHEDRQEKYEIRDERTVEKVELFWKRDYY
jgi:hypothetical protein